MLPSFLVPLVLQEMPHATVHGTDYVPEMVEHIRWGGIPIGRFTFHMDLATRPIWILLCVSRARDVIL